MYPTTRLHGVTVVIQGVKVGRKDQVLITSSRTPQTQSTFRHLVWGLGRDTFDHRSEILLTLDEKISSVLTYIFLFIFSFWQVKKAKYIQWLNIAR
jgi:hypothetical protein